MVNKINLNENYFPQGYRFLKATGGENSLEGAIAQGLEIVTERALLIKDRADYKYRIFNSYNHFAIYYPDDKLHLCDEVIFDFQAQRPKFDIDDYDPNQFETIYNTIEEYFVFELGIDAEIVICDSSGFDDKLKRHKNSAHIIITNCVFKKSSDAAITSQEIYNRLPENAKRVFDSVNKSIQHFRTPLSTKAGRRKEVPEGYSREDVMITANARLPAINITTKQGEKKPAKEIEADADSIIKEAAQYLIGWVFRKRVGNILLFNRTPSAETHCEFCDRDHTADNTRRLVISPNGILLKCIKSPKTRLIIRYNNGNGDSDKNIIAEAIAKEYHHTDYAVKLNFVQHDQYTDPLMKLFPQHKTLYVRANMKMGKTNTAIDYMKSNKFLYIVVVSFRKTFTSEKLTAFKSMGFRSYDDFEGPISFNYHPRIIIQAESLHRIKYDKIPDLILLDESESIFDEFLSSTMRQLRPCVNAFEWLVQNSRYCLSMDANLCDRTVALIRRMRGNDDEMLIVNNYKNMSADTITITDKKEELNAQILEFARGGKNMIIPTNSKKYADAVYKLIVDIIPPEQVLKITSETSDKDKTEIFSDVNNQWKKYRVVIFTPTCSAGVSFTETHFDTLFGYFTNSSTVVESWRQSMYRARDIASNSYNICINARQVAAYITSVDIMKQYIKTNFSMQSEEANELDYKIDRGGNFHFNEDLLFEIWSWTKFVQNISRASPIQTFVEQCALSGAIMTLFEPGDAAGIGIAENLYNRALKDIKLADYEQIAAAPELSNNEFNTLVDQTSKTTNDKHAMSKYILRRAYKWEGLIDIDFMQNYADKRITRSYRNLTNILQSDSIQVSLENIRADHKDIKEGLSITYARHKIACDLLSVCGFTGICCDKIITREELMKNILDKRPDLEKAMGQICFTFDGKSPLIKWDVKTILAFINGITDTMYGIKIRAISRTGKNRNLFIIKHSMYSSLFSKEDDGKPFIEINWKYKEMPDNNELNI